MHRPYFRKIRDAWRVDRIYSMPVFRLANPQNNFRIMGNAGVKASGTSRSAVVFVYDPVLFDFLRNNPRFRAVRDGGDDFYLPPPAVWQC
ncbi:MAG: hypothetical protein ACREBG_29615 [Pyrinomonadaceae bacterium]